MKKIVILLLMAQACASKVQDIVTISVDLQKTIELDVNTFPNIQTIVFDQTDVLLSGRGKVLFDNNIILIEERDSVMAFDYHGKYLNTVARKGRGPGEYTNISSLFTREGRIFIQNQNTIKVYDQKGGFIKEILPLQMLEETSLFRIYPARNDQYIIRCGSGVFYLLDTDFTLVKPIQKEQVGPTNMSFGEHFSSYNDEILYWNALCDTIYTTHNMEFVYPKYYIDFGTNSVPKEVSKKGTFEVMMFLNEDETDRYASFVKDIHECQDYLTAFFAYKEFYLYLLKYDKKKKQSQSYLFTDSGIPIEFDFSYYVIHTQGDKIMFYGGKGEEVLIRIFDVGDLP